MTYIHRGQVVDKKPFSFLAFLCTVWSLLCFFVMSIFTTSSLESQIDSYTNERRPGYSNRSSSESVLSRFTNRLLHPFNSGNNNNNSANGRGQTLGSRRYGNNVHMLPKGQLFGGCASGWRR